MITNSEAQEKLSYAIAVLDNTQEPSMEATIAHTLLSVIAERSASGNDIPGLRGLGLENALNLANEIIENGTRNIRIDTKSLAASIVVK